MSRQKRSFSAKFKSDLVIELFKGEKTLCFVGARLLGINRTSIYYKGNGISEEELVCKAIINHLHTDHPTWESRQMSKQ